MTDRAFRARLHHAFLLAVLTPAAACGGATFTPESGDSGGADALGGNDAVGSNDGPGTDASTGHDSAANDSSTGHDTGGGDVVVVDVVADRPTLDSSYDGGCGAGTPVGDAAVCVTYVTPPCGYDGGTIPTAECAALCNSASTFIACFGTTQNGNEVIECSTCTTGRRPTGMRGPLARDASAGDFFARCAWLEAASVHAFRRLARELTVHGAPGRLVARAHTAARDEVRHARTTASIAERFGAKARRPGQRRLKVRGLEAVARDNAVEGCVRETYGALVALWQARRASDPVVARALEGIARDEARHAAIAWEVAAWVEPRLRPSQRARIATARRAALAELRAEIAAEPPSDVADRAGVPGAPQAACLLDAMVSTVMVG